MQNKSFYLFAAETEGEMDSWVTTLKKVIQTNDSISTPSVDRLREKGKGHIFHFILVVCLVTDCSWSKRTRPSGTCLYGSRLYGMDSY